MLELIMDKIEEFYFGEGETGGEYIFAQFAQKNAHLFENDCDAENAENKLE